ncbi:Holliday junction branch migration protein RuvA [Candidatus Uhrbacteria bacterium]|nr:Holliday junction branch migration protein RuvA [Candidatus Uhrbacteria bacterium]
MLAYIKGTILRREKGKVIVVVQDIGYRIAVIEALLHKISEGQEIALYLHHHVRENSMELYGFIGAHEVDFFEQLLSVSGVGPKSALSIVNAAPVEKIKAAIARGDRTIFTGVSGVGGKTADRILIELRDRIGVIVAEDGGSGDDSDITEALIRLGYSSTIARSVVQSLPDTLIEVEERMKAALKSLGK